MDPIADMLTRLRNALAIKKSEVILPFSKIKYEIAKLLEKSGWIEKVEILDFAKHYPKNKKLAQGLSKQIKISLKYNEKGESIISNLQRISKPGQRIYVKKDKIHNVLNGLGMAVISTSQGLKTDKEARRGKIGGELICEIY